MSETTNTREMTGQKIETESSAQERSHRVTAVAWLAGLSAFFGFNALSMNASLGAGIGMLGITGMVTTACYFILRQR